MPSRHDRIEFSPPQEPGNLFAFSMAILIHALLIAALTWGVNWKNADKSVTYDAEIWSTIEQQAAPKEMLAPTPPAPKLPPVPVIPTPAPAPPPPPPPPPAPAVKVAPPEPIVDIALEEEKKRKELAKQKALDAKKLAALKAKQAEEKALKEAELEAEKLALANKEKALKLKQEQAKKEADLKAAEQKAAEQKLAEKKAAEQKAAQEALAAQKLKDQKEARQQAEKEKLAQAVRDKQRQDNLDRMKTQAGVAGASGGATDTGTALKSAGPSSSYGGKVRARLRPNIVFSDQLTDNPMSSVEVRSLPDGNIISQRLVKSSGNPAWDDAVLRAITRMGSMPLDINGRAPGLVILDLSPKDK
jgi:colicin import membrane protein